MTTYQPRTPHSDPIKRPDCSKCGTLTRLFGMSPRNPASNCYLSQSGRGEHK